MTLQTKSFYLNDKQYILDICSSGFAISVVVLVIYEFYKNGGSLFKVIPLVVVLLLLLGSFLLTSKEKIDLLPIALKNRSMPWIQLNATGIQFPHKSICISWDDVATIDFWDDNDPQFRAWGARRGKKQCPRIYIYHNNQITVIKEYLDTPLVDVALLLDAYFKHYQLKDFSV